MFSPHPYGWCLRPRSSTARESGGSALLPGRPDHALVHFRHWGESLVDEFLEPLAAIRLGGVDVTLRIHRDAMHPIKLAGLPSAVAKAVQDFERLAIQNVDLVVL